MKLRIILLFFLFVALAVAGLNWLNGWTGIPSLSRLKGFIKGSGKEVETPAAEINQAVEAGKQRNIVTIHVYTALCDNQYQGIVPVSQTLGDGDNPGSNLYWGASYGVRSYFERSRKWKLIKAEKKPADYILERCVFRYDVKEQTDNGQANSKETKKIVYMIADAYRGRNIKECLVDFLEAAAGSAGETCNLGSLPGVALPCAGNAGLVVYVGHNALMDFALDSLPPGAQGNQKQTIILCCKSKAYFKPALKSAGAFPLLWTTGLMAPEAYTLEAALDGWIRGEAGEAIRKRAADAYHTYQGCGVKGALRLLVSGW